MKSILNAALILLLLCSHARLSSEVAAQVPTTPTPDAYAERLRGFEDFVRASMERDRIPGMTIGFFKDDYTWVKGFGFADLENRVPAHADSAYRLASITKTMTGAAIVQLAERGRIDLDAEIQTYLPSYPKQKWPVTVRQLLVHTGGGQQGSGLGPEHVTPREVVARIGKYPIEVEPGTKYIYTTSGYNLLGAAIEEVTGKKFGDYLRENLWQPLGMKDTRMDDVRDIIPNRVRGYDTSSGEVRNAPFVDVSSRFGGGGATGTVPDLLRWARGILDGKVLAPATLEKMLAPVALKNGRYAGIGSDAEMYYTLGWIVLPVGGNFVMHNSGSQRGTDTTLYYFPAKRLAIAYASNLESAPHMPYIKRLYELLTDEPWDVRAHTRERREQILYTGLSNAFNYGSLHFEQHRRPLASDARELADAFAYFNASVNRGALQGDYAKTAAHIADGRHPVGNLSFIKVGSYIAARLREKYGAERAHIYHAGGPLQFFADYVELYKRDAKTPKELRLDAELEKLVARWNADWSRTWNEHTRRLRLTPETDFDAEGARLRREFAGAEIYPDFTDEIRSIQNGPPALKAAKLGIDLYPRSSEMNFRWGLYSLLASQNEKGRALLKQVAGDGEPPLVFFRRALEEDAQGAARAQTFLGLGRNWLNNPAMNPSGMALVQVALELHPRDAGLHEMLGDYLLKAGQKERAVESYRRAFAVDAAFGKGQTPEQFIEKKLVNGQP